MIKEMQEDIRLQGVWWKPDLKDVLNISDRQQSDTSVETKEGSQYHVPVETTANYKFKQKNLRPQHTFPLSCRKAENQGTRYQSNYGNSQSKSSCLFWDRCRIPRDRAIHAF